MMLNWYRIGKRIIWLQWIGGLCMIGLYGPDNVLSMYHRYQRHQQVANEIGQLGNDVNQLKLKIDDWHVNSFQKECIAREQLQMARACEIIYYIA